jgi:hypothetical protein
LGVEVVGQAHPAFLDGDVGAAAGPLGGRQHHVADSLQPRGAGGVFAAQACPFAVDGGPGGGQLLFGGGEFGFAAGDVAPVVVAQEEGMLTLMP